MNPLRKKQIEKLEDLGLTDVARKIQELVDAHNELLDTHTVKEEAKHPSFIACSDERHKGTDDYSTTSDNYCQPKEEPTTPEKKECFYCGKDYTDPKYCSVFGRTADEHKWL